MNQEKMLEKARDYAEFFYYYRDTHYNGLKSGYEKGYKEGAKDFANWLRKNAQPRFPNQNEWVLINDPNNILTLDELYEKFEKD